MQKVIIPNFENYKIDFKNEKLFSCKNGLEKEIKIHISIYGYKTFTLCKDGKPKMMFLHRLKAFLYLSNPKKKPCINHIDGNKLNNDLSNLEWCTKSENSLHAHKNGLMKSKGESNGRAKINYEIAQKIRSEYIPFKNSRKELGLKYGVSKSMIDKILNKDNWK